MRQVLIIDDEKNICVSLTYALEDYYKVKWVHEPSKGMEFLENQPVDLVLLDLKIGQYNGIEVLKKIKEFKPEVPVIIMTGFGSIESSVEAVKAGAYHYISKPIKIDGLLNLMNKALEHAGLNRKVQELNRQLEAQKSPLNMIGKSAAMRELFRIIDKVKDINSNVLILGESGTGKEMIARAIHYGSSRKDYPFEAINCSAIPVNLLESEFFGHRKGAFTGADTDHKGKFEFCHKGTLLLDEIGDMDPAIQVKLLRVLQDREITPVGSNQKIKVDVRVIAATNKDLKKAVEDGDFREDLFYRLNVITVRVPPLRERKEDIPFLVQHFIRKYNERFNKHIMGIDSLAMRTIERYRFNGNIRELENIIERGVAMSDSKIITLADLPELDLNEEVTSNFENMELAGKTLEQIEKEAIMITLKIANNNKTKAAAMLGITDRTLRNKLERYKYVK